MADNSTLPVDSGTEVFANDDIGGVKYPRAKLALGADGAAVDAVGGSGTNSTAVQRVTVATDDALHTILGATGDAASLTTTIKAALRGIATALGITALDLGSGTGGTRTLRTFIDTAQVSSNLDCQTTVTRPGNTTTYTANDAIANSTSAPTAGGFTFTNAASASGGGGRIESVTIVSSKPDGTPLTGEIWFFDQAVTAINDADPFLLSDADALFCVGIVPFTLEVKATNNAIAFVPCNVPYHCVGTANLRFLIKTTIAYVPANAETITVRIQGVRT